MPLVYIFLHIAKTAGKRLQSHFSEHLELGETFYHLMSPLKVHEYPREQRFELAPLERRLRAKVLLGHGVTRRTPELLPGRAARFVTFLRDPAELIVSRYNFRMADYNERLGLPITPFEEWLAVEGYKAPCAFWVYRKFLLKTGPVTAAQYCRVAQEALERFWFVGNLDTLQADVDYLMGEIGLPPLDARVKANVSGVNFKKRKSLDPESVIVEIIDDVSAWHAAQSPTS